MSSVSERMAGLGAGAILSLLVDLFDDEKSVSEAL
jgi:hypothetical protein